MALDFDKRSPLLNISLLYGAVMKDPSPGHFLTYKLLGKFPQQAKHRPQ